MDLGVKSVKAQFADDVKIQDDENRRGLSKATL